MLAYEFASSAPALGAVLEFALGARKPQTESRKECVSQARVPLPLPIVPPSDVHSQSLAGQAEMDASTQVMSEKSFYMPSPGRQINI